MNVVICFLGKFCWITIYKLSSGLFLWSCCLPYKFKVLDFQPSNVMLFSYQNFWQWISIV
uniref:Uncharacterized protein n=1 Tax=Rhizophora mucronata TaxID=61149 RepID=A0A2P2IL78_RHIMU